MKGDSGLEFVEFAEGPTKTRSGCSRLAKRDVQLHYFASTSDVGLPILGWVVHFISQWNTTEDLAMKFGTKSSPLEKIEWTSWGKISSLKPPLSHLRSGFPITMPAKHSLARRRKQISRSRQLQKSLVTEMCSLRWLRWSKDEQRQLWWAISDKNSTANPCQWPVVHLVLLLQVQ